MRFLYFDLGCYRGEEIQEMINIFDYLKIDDYLIYGFEPCKKTYDNLANKFKFNNKVKLINGAISNETSTKNLYHAPNEDGHSIFESKVNVNPNDFESINTYQFSNWLNSIDYKNSTNIMKFNIEGAEYYLLKDLVNNNLLQYFPILCGDIWDVKKLKNFEHMEEYTNLLKDNNINVVPFSAQGGFTKPGESEWMIKQIKYYEKL